MAGSNVKRPKLYAVHAQGRMVTAGTLEKCWARVMQLGLAPEDLARQGVYIAPYIPLAERDKK